jgi:hypothetical protein
MMSTGKSQVNVLYATLVRLALLFSLFLLSGRIFLQNMQ